MATLNSVAKH